MDILASGQHSIPNNDIMETLAIWKAHNKRKKSKQIVVLSLYIKAICSETYIICFLS